MVNCCGRGGFVLLRLGVVMAGEYPPTRGMTTSPVGFYHTTDTTTKTTIPTLNTDPQPRVVRV